MAKVQNIIIIEDNETFSLLVTHYLKTNLGNANVFVENSGARAIESIKRLKPSLVILDYYLENELSAIDVMEVINAMVPRPKVILLSSITDEREKQQVMSMGIERFVPKSNESFYELLRVIEDLLDHQTDSNLTSTSGSLSAGQKTLIAAVSVLALIAITLWLIFT